LIDLDLLDRAPVGPVSFRLLIRMGRIVLADSSGAIGLIR